MFARRRNAANHCLMVVTCVPGMVRRRESARSMGQSGPQERPDGYRPMADWRSLARQAQTGRGRPIRLQSDAVQSCRVERVKTVQRWIRRERRPDRIVNRARDDRLYSFPRVWDQAPGVGIGTRGRRSIVGIHRGMSHMSNAACRARREIMADRTPAPDTPPELRARWGRLRGRRKTQKAASGTSRSIPRGASARR